MQLGRNFHAWPLQCYVLADVLPFQIMADGGEGRRPGKFAAFAWTVLAYNVLVILWGTVVRATSSGQGCGDHWPLCQGTVIPHGDQIATLIEFSHRASSGIDVVLVVALIYLAFRRFGRGHAVRRYAAAAGFFTLTEALVGAALVLFGAVGKNVTTSGVIILSVHLVNTFLLLATLTLTAWAAGRQLSAESADAPPRPQPPAKGASITYGAGLVGTLAIAITGTFAALADTLYPAKSLMEALHWDFTGASPPILHLRIIHPVVAVLIGGYLLILAVLTLSSSAHPAAKKMARRLGALVLLQFALGAINIVLLTPVWMQVLHLLNADLIWITLVLLSAEALGWQAETIASSVSQTPTPVTSAGPVQQLPISR